MAVQSGSQSGPRSTARSTADQVPGRVEREASRSLGRRVSVKRGLTHDSPFYEASRFQIETWRGSASAWYITWGIAYEFLRVVTHRRVLEQPWTVKHAWAFLQALLASPGLSVLLPTGRHASVADEVFSELPHLRGNLIHDATTAILMREHGIKVIYTQDTDFHRFPFLEPVDPTV